MRKRTVTEPQLELLRLDESRQLQVPASIAEAYRRCVQSARCGNLLAQVTETRRLLRELAVAKGCPPAPTHYAAVSHLVRAGLVPHGMRDSIHRLGDATVPLSLWPTCKQLLGDAEAIVRFVFEGHTDLPALLDALNAESGDQPLR